MPVSPATIPSLDFSGPTTLEALLRQKYRVVRQLVDPQIPGGALPSWLYSPSGAGTVTFPTQAIGGITVTSGTTSGNAAVIRGTKDGGTTALTLTPAGFGALAITFEGLTFSATTGFDFQLGFSGNASTVGGCAYYQPNGQALGEIRTYGSTAGSLSKTPRTVTDAVTNGTTTITSATAAFDSTYDLNQPLTESSGGVVIPSSKVAAVGSSTSITSSIAAQTTATGQSLTIGQAVNYTAFATGKRNLTLLWWTTDAVVWLMSDDQVIAEVDLSKVANYSPTSLVQVQMQVITRVASAIAMTWNQAKLTYAHN